VSSPWQHEALEWWGDEAPDKRAAILGKLYRLIEKRLPPGPGKALDLGSGNGKVVAMLLKRGYSVTAVDVDPEVVQCLAKRFPGVRVMRADLSRPLPLRREEDFHVVTMIYTAQSLPPGVLQDLLASLRPVIHCLVMEIANSRSLYCWWVRFRGFTNGNPVYPMSPGKIEDMLRRVGFNVTYRRGVGLLMPMSLFDGYRCQFVPSWLAKAVSCLDRLFTRWCHLYYIEAE